MLGELRGDTLGLQELETKENTFHLITPLGPSLHPALVKMHSLEGRNCNIVVHSFNEGTPIHGKGLVKYWHNQGILYCRFGASNSLYLCTIPALDAPV